jgi:cyclopropane-fatty-acyl-phospholipid synthase
VIITPDSRYDSLRKGVDWIQKYIFPGSLLPSIARINQAVNRTGDMFLHDLKDLGLHYARTLNSWRDNFNRHRQNIVALGFDERFSRKWNYYFSYCEAAFSMKNISVVQMIYARPNNALLRREDMMYDTRRPQNYRSRQEANI